MSKQLKDANVKKVLDNIKALRAIRGYSQEHVAKLLDVDYSTYGKMENGYSALTIERLFKLTEIFEVSPYNILFGYDAKDPNIMKEAAGAAITDNGTIKINLEIPLSLLQEKLKK